MCCHRQDSDSAQAVSAASGGCFDLAASVVHFAPVVQLGPLVLLAAIARFGPIELHAPAAIAHFDPIELPDSFEHSAPTASFVSAASGAPIF